ncbi:helix-turn-helix transcriptional regulator [Burkholderia multivorans]|uniref:helix-turn-helix transcriptional regulator n=1 Tax=Burkholderia multivorans TaxID=87883 RepID=UPI001C237A71|nr:helix-turn-helix domain-containing protein [Burkholderia multivorans]MBU9247800.1 helix-turn-helix domain-containing protein [Burkholderia multivorans]
MTTRDSDKQEVNLVEERFLTPREVAARYGDQVSVRTLSNWRWSGTGPEFIKIGGKVLYKLSDLEQWEESRKASSTSKSSTA